MTMMVMMWRRFKIGFKLLTAFVLLVLIVAPEWPAFAGERHRLDVLVGLRQFDFVNWEIDALTVKLTGELADGHSYLDEEENKQFVLNYLGLLGEVRALEREVDANFANPEIVDPALASADLQADIAFKREDLSRRQPLAEAIVQEQVATVLIEEGFDLMKLAWPPVIMHMTPLPQILIVSPREEIRQIHNVPLEHGFMTPAKEELEQQVYSHLDRSALVVPIGGLGLIPSMIIETSNINYLADVVAHEWAHHWLTTRPVGLGYAASPEMRAINETVASILGEEVGAKVIERFYPEHVPPEAESASEVEEDDLQPVFDFRQEMAKTRIHVDELLAMGEVDEAEAYMESRRQVFVDNGYQVRKLNQAYFAFYGAYADTPGATGDDPIGPALVALREQSGSLREFMNRVAFVTNFESLQRAVGEAGKPSGAP